MGVGAGVGVGITKAASMMAKIGLEFGAVEASRFVLASKMLTTRLVSYSVGAASGALTSGVVSSAARKEDIGSEKTWENIGIGVGVAVGMALLTAGVQSMKMNRIDKSTGRAEWTDPIAEDAE
jgi:hypothetical protein